MNSMAKLPFELPVPNHVLGLKPGRGMSGTSFEPLRTSVYGQGDNGSAWRVSVKISYHAFAFTCRSANAQGPNAAGLRPSWDGLSGLSNISDFKTARVGHGPSWKGLRIHLMQPAREFQAGARRARGAVTAHGWPEPRAARSLVSIAARNRAYACAARARRVRSAVSASRDVGRPRRRRRGSSMPHPRTLSTLRKEGLFRWLSRR